MTLLASSRRWPFRFQILALLLSIAVIAAVSPLIIALPRLRDAATDLAYKRLRSAARTKADWARHEFNRMSNDLLVASESGAALDTLIGFKEALDQLTQSDPDGGALKQLKERLRRQVAPEPSPPRRIRRQPPADEMSEYERLVREMYPFLQLYDRGYGYANTLYVESDTGRVDFSLTPSRVTLESLLQAPHKDTLLGRVFARVVQNPRLPGPRESGFRRISAIGRVHFADFEASPDGGPPAACLGAPLFDEGRLVGVLMNLVPPDGLNGIMTQIEGMGDTGETYLVGPDSVLRTESRFDATTGIPRRKVDTVAVREALAGNEGQGVIEDYRGVATLAFWMPIQVFDTRWALVAQMDQAEVYGFIGQSVRNIATWSAALGFCLVFICFAFARKVDRPLAALVRRARLLAEGREVMPVKDPVSGRELNELVESFHEMAGKIRDRTAALEAARQEAELSAEEATRATEVKTEFLGIASHDLKSPLTVVLGASSALKELAPVGAVVTERLHALTDRIIVRAQQMQRIIEDFLELHALEAGQIKLDIGPVPWSQAARNVVDINSDYAQSKGIELGLELCGENLVVMADAARVDQVAQNLVGNAIKFSAPGARVVVRARVGNGEALLEVIDEGPGLSDEDMEKLFTRYARLENKPTGGEKSSGLGLAISKEMIERLGGRIGARNNPDCGATFWFSLPLDPGATAAAADSPGPRREKP